MKNLTPELIAKAKTAKSADELFALAKENGVEITADEAKTYFAQLNANGAVSDGELDAVAGGGDCFDWGSTETTITVGKKVKVINGQRCIKCNDVMGVIVAKYGTTSAGNGSTMRVACAKCGAIILNYVNTNVVEFL